jgi:soluble lytic murein transglycosylase
MYNYDFSFLASAGIGPNIKGFTSLRCYSSQRRMVVESASSGREGLSLTGSKKGSNSKKSYEDKGESALDLDGIYPRTPNSKMILKNVLNYIIIYKNGIFLQRSENMRRSKQQFKKWLFLWTIMLVIVHKPVLQSFFILDYKPQIVAYSKNNDLSPALVSAIIFTESRFNASAQSNKGALGLMQVMPSTGQWVARQLEWDRFSKQDLLNPEKNLELGVWYLAYLKRYFNYNESLALASYNAGHRYVSEWLAERVWDGDLVTSEKIPFPETKDYVVRINFFKKIYQYLYPDLKACAKIDQTARL